MSYTIELTYFKPSGKYYTNGAYVTNLKSMYQIFEQVQKLKDSGELPGLGVTSDHYIIHIYAPEHPNYYPGLIL